MGGRLSKKPLSRQKLSKMLMVLPNWLFGASCRLVVNPAVLDVRQELTCDQWDPEFVLSSDEEKTPSGGNDRRRRKSVYHEVLESNRMLKDEVRMLREEVAKIMGAKVMVVDENKGII